MAFEIVQIPHDHEGARSWVERYKAFRLHALKTEPSAFGSTYEREAAWGDEVWYSRLSKPEAVTFLALQEGRVVSTLTTMGHLQYGPDDLPLVDTPWQAAIEVSEKPTPLHYRIFGMFTSPDCRGQGMAKALMKRAIEAGKKDADELNRPYIGSIVVDEANQPATALYQRSGFVATKTLQFGDAGRMAVLMKYVPELAIATKHGQERVTTLGLS